MKPVSHRFPLVALALLSMVLSRAVPALAETPPTAEASPTWQVETSPLRGAYFNDRGRISTIELPSRLPDGTLLADVAAFAGTKRLPARRIGATDRTLTAVVDSSEAPEGAEITVYALPRSLSGGPAFTNTAPVHFRVSQSGVFEAPPTVRDMLAMADGHPRHPVYEFDIKAVGYVKSGKQGSRRGWYRGNWRNYTYLAEYTGLMRVPEDGLYRFAAAKRATGPVYLLVDGEVVIDLPNKGMVPLSDRSKGAAGSSVHEWVAGGTIELRKGLVPYRALTFCKRFCEITLGWVPPSAADGASPVAIPDDAWAAATPVRAIRVDRRDRQGLISTAIDVRTEPEDSYAFDGLDALFLPLHASSLHSRDSGTPVDCSWAYQQAGKGRGPSWEGAGIVATVVKEDASRPDPTLKLTVKDREGHRAVHSKATVPFPRRASIRHRLTAALDDVPPFLYGSDSVRPELEIRTTLPDRSPLLVRATYLPVEPVPGHPPVSVEEEVFPIRNWCRSILPPGRASELAGIEWEVVHMGCVVASGKTRFEHAPFRRAPDGALGADLVKDGEPIVYVARRARNGEAPPRPVLGPDSTILLIDGFASAGGGLGPEGLAAFARSLSPSSGAGLSVRALRGDGTAMGRGLPRSRRGLAVTARLPALDRPDLIVIAPDFLSTGEGAPLTQFERELAALAGIASDALQVPTVILTPPPGLLATAPLASPPEMRPYAEAVLRVADAHGLPVADLYSLCRMRGVATIAPDGAFTPEGARLAGEAVRLALSR